jgi:hypothetical protein
MPAPGKLRHLSSLRPNRSKVRPLTANLDSNHGAQSTLARPPSDCIESLYGHAVRRGILAASTSAIVEVDNRAPKWLVWMAPATDSAPRTPHAVGRVWSPVRVLRCSWTEAKNPLSVSANRQRGSKLAVPGVGKG